MFSSKIWMHGSDPCMGGRSATRKLLFVATKNAAGRPTALAGTPRKACVNATTRAKTKTSTPSSDALDDGSSFFDLPLLGRCRFLAGTLGDFGESNRPMDPSVAGSRLVDEAS